MVRLLSILAIGTLVAACSSSGDRQGEAPVIEKQGSAPTGAGPEKPKEDAKAEPQRIGTVKPDPIDELAAGTGMLAKRSIYFDLDSFDIKPEFRPIVEAHATYLRKNPGRKVVVEGNTDERGSREYNLSLGQKRAEAVKKMLSLLGVPESQLEAVSFGEEKPKAAGKDDASYAENRRGDLSYRAPQ